LLLLFGDVIICSGNNPILQSGIFKMMFYINVFNLLFVSCMAIFVLKRDVKLQLTNCARCVVRVLQGAESNAGVRTGEEQ